MTSRDARRTFLEFFATRDHRIVPSSPLVLPQDPTLLFANAGMNQFKEVFTGRELRDYRRAASVQKCLRVSGKHNDLEMVGRTPRHHTFFEMLGNFSFGDYFKEQAIALAWELVTGSYGLPADRLWITVFAGTAELSPDHEARSIWRDRIGVPEARILQLGERENFWRMGESGPCGPCSELHYDLGQDLASSDPSTPATDERRFVEIWNLVFMQFDQGEDGTLTPLPSPSIDTGMGLERISAVLQGQRSNFETDLFRPILYAAAARAGVRYGQDESSDFSLRVIADHARALCFLVADGVTPANDRRGYVLRRLMRRAIRHGRKLGLHEPFLQEVTPVVIEGLGDVYPELLGAREAILEIGRREEQRFAETLAAGLTLLEDALSRTTVTPGAAHVLSGKELFKLYDTYGLPLDLARDIAAERNVQLDEAGFEEEMARQRARAQASWKGARQEIREIYAPLAGKVQTEFVGYDRTWLGDVPVVAVLLERGGSSVDPLVEGSTGNIVLEATPFYAEAGGQIGDTGWIVGPQGRARVTDTYRAAEGIVAHRVRVEAGRIAPRESVRAEVDAPRREAIQRNHTATHLLHAALREVVGTHVKQAGSLVAFDRLRFDFSHFAGLSEEALSDIESLVNRKVLENQPIETQVLRLDEALQSGAMALFGEKYGERVRVVRIGDFSLELCGGTHCARSGAIGLFKLIEERGIASGTRRVEGVTGEGSLDRFRHEHAIVRALEGQLSVPRERLLEEVGRKLEQLREVERNLERERVGAVRERLKERAKAPQIVSGVKLITERVEGLSPQEMRGLADNLRQALGSGVVILGRADGGKASLLVAVSDDLKRRIPAGELVRELGPIIGGSGGGRPEMAEAGGRDPSRLDEALRKAGEAIERRMMEVSS